MVSAPIRRKRGLLWTICLVVIVALAIAPVITSGFGTVLVPVAALFALAVVSAPIHPDLASAYESLQDSSFLGLRAPPHVYIVRVKRMRARPGA